MELVKNIFFNTDKLVENSKIKISYTGKFFQDNSEKVSIHYGFGNNWDNLTSTQMVKTELGYQIEIEIGEVETFNFCFCNEKNEWDNNNGKNYIFVIEKQPVELITLEDEPVSLGSARKLRKSYIWSKKIRLAVYKIITYLPRIISGNYFSTFYLITHPPFIEIICPVVYSSSINHSIHFEISPFFPILSRGISSFIASISSAE